MKLTRNRAIVAIALLVLILSAGMASFATTAPPPSLTVFVTTHRTSPTLGFDSIIYVSVPHQMPFNPPGFNLLQSFVLQSIDVTQAAPDGTITTTNLVTCSLSSTPAYPSRFTVSTCSGFFPYRVDSRAYPGSTTGIYWVGFGGLTPIGLWRFTYTVTGLYNGATTTFAASFNVNVDPGPATGPVQFT